MAKYIAIGILGLMLLVAVIGTVQFSGPKPRIVVSPQTTVVTEPLTEDGLPDYARVILDELRGDTTPEENGAIPLLQALWPAELFDSASQQAVCAEVGMEVPAHDGMREPASSSHGFQKQLEQRLLEQWAAVMPPADDDGFPVMMQRQLANKDASTMMTLLTEQPWTAEQYPMVAEWIEANKPSFDLLLESAARPKFYGPSPTLLLEPTKPLYEMLLPFAQATRTAIRCLSTRANYHLGRGDLSAAWVDCRACYRIGDHVQRDSVIGVLVGIACTRVANRIALRVLESENLTIEQAHEIESFLAQRRSRKEMKHAIDKCERLCYVTLVLAFADGRHGEALTELGLGDGHNHFLKALERASIDWNVVLRKGNSYFDLYRDALDSPTSIERSEKVARISQDLSEKRPSGPKIALSLVSRTARSELMGDILNTLTMPGLEAALQAEESNHAELDLMKVAARLALRKLESGTYPDTLAELETADWTLPADVFGAATLGYIKTTDGYLLYSFGPDGQDSRGCNYRLSQFEGYSLSDPSEPAVLELIGATSGFDVRARIPKNSDDIAIRLPQPVLRLPLRESPLEELKATMGELPIESSSEPDSVDLQPSELQPSERQPGELQSTDEQSSVEPAESSVAP